jgi:hypothetical protein
VTPISVRSLPLSLQELKPSHLKIPETRRRSASRLSDEFQQNTKAKERKGERKRFELINQNLFLKRGEV